MRCSEGEPYSIWWQATLVPQDVEDGHDLCASQWLSLEGIARGFRSIADGLFKVAAVVRQRDLDAGLKVLSRNLEGVLRFIDASHFKVHQDACGGCGGKELQAIGHTRGGANSELHAMVDDKGRLVRAILTAGQVSDMKIGPELVKGVGGVRIVGDKGYDSKAIRQAASHSGSFSCIPQRAGGVEPVPFHKGYYRHRHHVENFFQRIKRLRRIATRYDKLAEVFLNFILPGASLDWIDSF